MIHWRARWIFISLFVVATSLGAQSPARPDSVPRMDSARLLGNLSALAADSMEGRRAGTRGGARARAFLLREFARVGLPPALVGFESSFYERSIFPEQSLSNAMVPRRLRPMDARGGGTAGPGGPPAPPQFPMVSGVNLVGLVRGTERPDRYIIVSAHYDHVGIRKGEVYDGADDNASGTAAVLAIAEWFVAHPPRNSILFAWFDGGESGLLGSQAFVRRPAVPLEKIAAEVNVDMVSRSTRGELFAAGTGRHPVMRPLVDSLAAIALVIVRQGHDGTTEGDDWTNRSDMGPFNDHRVPFVHFGVEEHADYHQPGDRFDHIMPGFYYRSARTIAEFIRRLDGGLDAVAEARAGRPTPP
jgi:hypothetical protein